MTKRQLSAAFPFVDAFDAVREDLPGAPLDWLQAARRDALARFRDQSLPNRRVEAWKYTDLGALAKTDFAAPDGPISDALTARIAQIGAPDAVRLVIANGRLDPTLSNTSGLPAGARLVPMSVALDSHSDLLKDHVSRVAALDGDGLIALNAAFMMDGYVLIVDDAAAIDPTIEVIFAGDGGQGPVALHPRNVIIMGRDSAATIIETHLGEGVYWTNPLTDVVMGACATLRRYKVQQDGAEAFHLAQDQISLAAGAHYRGFLGAFGAKLARQTVTATINGGNAAFDIAGAYLLRGSQHNDITTVVDHAAAGSTSRQVFKGVLDDAARGVFQGKVAVHRDAQKTDAHQLNNALLLSDKAEIDAKPELEIYADDVKCSHGATAGDLDENELFYLQARGIGASEARRLLVSAFVKAALDEIDRDTDRARFETLVDRWLEDANA
jgi:Fe-S cluster assembly protein SufD